jgi:hypothetical protein
MACGGTNNHGVGSPSVPTQPARNGAVLFISGLTSSYSGRVELTQLTKHTAPATPHVNLYSTVCIKPFFDTSYAVTP